MMAASPPAAPTFPPSWAHEDRGPAVMAIFWTEASITVVVALARLYSRMSIRSLGPDDVFMFITTLAFVVVGGIVTRISYLGGYRHLPFVPLENASQVALYNLIGQAFTVFAYGTGKFAVGYLILRLLPPSSKWRKWTVWIIISFTLFYNWLQIILTFVQCHPAEATWDMTIPGECWSQTRKFVNIYVGGVYNIIVDIILALLPVSFIWKLKIDMKQRALLCILLGLGLLAAVCSTVKLTYVPGLGEQDVTWTTYDITVWSGSELFVIIVTGSVPPLKILWDRAIGKKPASRASNYQYPASNDCRYIELSKNKSTVSSRDTRDPLPVL